MNSKIITINPWSTRESIAAKFIGLGGSSSGSLATLAYPANNLAIYVPFSINSPIIVNNLWWINGTLGTPGNVDVGVFDENGVKLVSTTSTGQVGASAVQNVTVSNTYLNAGLFYIGLSCSSTSAQLFALASGNLNFLIMCGVAQEASALPLPSVATFATCTSDYLPSFGLSTVGAL